MNQCDTQAQSTFEEIIVKNPKSMCLYPFTHINFKTHGGVAPCFRSLPVGDLHKDSIEEIWNNESWRAIRKNMLNGVLPPECISCKRLEESGAISYRMDSISDRAVHSRWRGQVAKCDTSNGQMPFEAKELELRFSNICNLKCRVCGPSFSSKWESDWVKETPIVRWQKKNGVEYKQFNGQKQYTDKGVLRLDMVDLVKKMAPHLEYLMITGGEPLLDDKHYEVLDILNPYAENITLEYTSNLNQLGLKNKSALSYWPDFKKVILKVSIDSDRRNYSYIRHGGDINLVEECISNIFDTFYVSHAESQSKDPLILRQKIKLLLTATTSVYNVNMLPEMAKYFTELGGFFHSSQVQYPYFLSSQILPVKYKQEITQRTSEFLSNLDSEMASVWGSHRVWDCLESRDLQVERIHKYVTNSLQHMNGVDDSKNFHKFFEFEDLYNASNGQLPENSLEVFTWRR